MDKTYRTIQGDTFDSIAWRLCGDEHQCRQIMEANPDYMDFVIFPAGVELAIPALARKTAKVDLPPWHGSSKRDAP